MNLSMINVHLGRAAALLGSVLVVLALVLVGNARASVLDSASISLSNTPQPTGALDQFGNPAYAPGTFSRQAGDHPDLTVKVAVPQSTAPNGGVTDPGPTEALRTVDVDLPLGFVGNPTAIASCSAADLSNNHSTANCPIEAQVGVIDLLIAQAGGATHLVVGVYNLSHGPSVAASFGFNYGGAIAIINARVRPGDFGISSGSFSISQALSLQSVSLELWGIPADPSHDAERQFPGTSNVIPGFSVPTTAARAPFLTNPTSCTNKPVSFTLRADSWEHPGDFDTRILDADPDGTPFVFDGCDKTVFSADINVQPTAKVADAPSGLDVDLTVAQDDNPDGLSTADVRRVVTTLPPGVSVSPSSAAGLGACSPAQVGLGSNDAPACPDSSKIGSVVIDTPLLADPLNGDVVLATQNANPFNSLIALYIVAKGPGFYLKLAGRVDLDPETGRVTATFDNTPQLPFSRLHLVFNGGADAPLAMPFSCGTGSTHAEVTSWASDKPVVIENPMTIDQGCDSPGFAPSFTAGTTNPQAGQHSSFVINATRADRTPYLASIQTVLPAGLLAEIASVPQCPESLAATGSCSPSAQIGTTSVLSGPGSAPLALKGQVYLTGPYKDAPFGLSIAVPTAGQAGPFDLGVVVVRAGIYVDRTDAHVTVKSDPLPTIIQGIPLRMRQVNVTIDRPDFILNPTSCAQKSVAGLFGATSGVLVGQSAPFRVGGCGDLTFAPKLAVTLSGKGQTTDGKHPALSARVTTKAGQANIQKAAVKLPLSLALDPDNANGLCEPADAAANKCPAKSIVGRATARSVLPDLLSGPVYFVRGERKDPKSGRTIRTLPKLYIPLTGDGVTIDLHASSEVSHDQLVTTFDNVPDAPVSDFRLDITGGKHGILVVSGTDICKNSQIADQQMTGQDGDIMEATTTLSTPACPVKILSKKITPRTVTLRIGGLGAGKITVTGRGIKKTTKTISKSTVATITAKRTKGRLGKIRVAYAAKGAAKAEVATATLATARKR